jgi:hypothetical protein
MRLTATGTFSDDTTLDVTSQVSWKSSAKKRVSVKTGLVRAIKTSAPVTVTSRKGHNGFGHRYGELNRRGRSD